MHCVRKRLGGLIAILLAAQLVGCAANPAARKLTAEQRELNVQSFDQIWETIRDKHFDPKLNGADWDGARAELRPQVEAAETMGAARAAMNDLISRLKQTHFAVIPSEAYVDIDADAGKDATGKKDESRPSRGDDGDLGFDVRVIDGAALVTEVRPGPAMQADVRLGWEVIAVDDVKLPPIFDRIQKNIHEPKFMQLYLRSAVMRRLAADPGDEVKVTFRDGPGKEHKLSLRAVEPTGFKTKFGHMPTQHVRFDAKRLEGNIAYVSLSMWFDPANVMKQFEQAVGEMSDCRGFIIDIRGNPGGIGGMSMGMAGWFTESSGQRLGVMTTRNSELKFVVNPRPRPFRGPVAVLIDDLSMSTSEIFAGGIKDIGRARLFGVATPGAALPSQIERLPNGDRFQYAFANYTSSSGLVLEGNGVKPDVEAPHTREALLSGKDNAIAAASEWILSQPTAPAAAQ